jgi:tRNA threonylcarbamoyl adenosine modification protein YeaZ
MPWFGSIDLSGATGSISLFSDQGLVCEVALEGPFKHSERLFGTLQELLKANGLAPADVSAWYLNQGPGSFTGLRIAMSAVKGICAVTGAELKTVCGARARALGWWNENGSPDITAIWVASPASAKQFTLHRYQLKDGQLELVSATTEPALVPPGVDEVLLVEKESDLGIFWPGQSRFLPLAALESDLQDPSLASPRYWGAKEFVKSPLFAAAE